MIGPARLPDWAVRLATYVAVHSVTPYREGRFDCALFVAGGVDAMTGSDFVSRWRGYRSKAAGLRRLRSAGYSAPVDLVAALFDQVDTAAGRAGDVAMIGATLGLIQGPRFVYCVGPAGVGLVDRAAVDRVFEVKVASWHR